MKQTQTTAVEPTFYNPPSRHDSRVTEQESPEMDLRRYRRNYKEASDGSEQRFWRNGICFLEERIYGRLITFKSRRSSQPVHENYLPLSVEIRNMMKECVAAGADYAKLGEVMNMTDKNIGSMIVGGVKGIHKDRLKALKHFHAEVTV